MTIRWSRHSASVVPADCLTVVVNESALAQQLLSAPVGVVFIDAGMAHPPGAMAQLVRRLYNQLPDIVLVVAGDGAAQTELAPLVTDGTIYRFVHKPVSAQRVKLFIDAAWRKRDGSSASGLYPALPVAPSAPAPPAGPLRGVPWPAALAGVLVLGTSLAWIALRPGAHPPSHAPVATLTPEIVPKPAPAVIAAPPSAAADLDRLATAAEQALLAGNLADAVRLTDAARAIDPGHVRVRFLTTQIAREQSRVAARRRAAGQAEVAAAAPPPVPAPTPSVAPAVVAAAGPAPVAALTPVVAASATTTSDAPVTHEAASSGPPSSTPPVSEARDPYSVAAVILERVYSPDPVFPEIAREDDLTGFVDLEFMVRADGTVSDVNVLKAQPRGVFEKAAVDAVSKWRYRPIERNGTAVDQHARLRLNFGYR